MMPQIRVENRMVRNQCDHLYKPVATCDECGALIYEGDYFYEFDGDTVCESCEPDYVRDKFRRCIE